MAGRSYSGRTNVGTTRRKSVGARYGNGSSQNDKRSAYRLPSLKGWVAVRRTCSDA